MRGDNQEASPFIRAVLALEEEETSSAHCALGSFVLMVLMVRVLLHGVRGLSLLPLLESILDGHYYVQGAS